MLPFRSSNRRLAAVLGITCGVVAIAACSSSGSSSSSTPTPAATSRVGLRHADRLRPGRRAVRRLAGQPHAEPDRPGLPEGHRLHLHRLLRGSGRWPPRSRARCTGRHVHQRQPEGQRLAGGPGQRQLGHLVRHVRHVAAGARLQPEQQVRQRHQDQALVPGDHRARVPARAAPTRRPTPRASWSAKALADTAKSTTCRR